MTASIVGVMLKPLPPDLDALGVDGVFLRRDALAAGHDDRSIARLVRVGIWHRVRHGAYIDGATWQALNESDRHRVLLRAALRTAKSECAASHLSAAVELGAPTWDLDLSTVHLTRLDQKSGRAEAGIAQHRGKLGEDQLVDVHGIPLTNGTRTAIDVIRVCDDPEHALVVVNGLLHAGHTTLDKLEAGHREAERWPGSRSGHIVLRLADPRAESAGESRTQFLCWRHRLPRGTPQYEVFDERGQFVARVDLAWPELGVFVEFDGMQKYTRLLRPGETTADVVIREKRREELICRITGWRCIRLTWADLEHPGQILASLTAALGGGPQAA